MSIYVSRLSVISCHSSSIKIIIIIISTLEAKAFLAMTASQYLNVRKIVQDLRAITELKSTKTNIIRAY